jgi:hypothetical protein
MSAAPICLLVHFGVQRDFAELTAIRPSAWALLVGIAVLCMFLPASLQAEGCAAPRRRAGLGALDGRAADHRVARWALLGERLMRLAVFGDRADRDRRARARSQPSARAASRQNPTCLEHDRVIDELTVDLDGRRTRRLGALERFDHCARVCDLRAHPA